MECKALWSSCKDEKRTTFGKSYGIKVCCSWEQLEHHMENIKINPISKRKPQAPLGCMLHVALLAGQDLFLEFVSHHFQPRLLGGTYNWGAS
jgi:hypothetical protein